MMSGSGTKAAVKLYPGRDRFRVHNGSRRSRRSGQLSDVGPVVLRQPIGRLMFMKIAFIFALLVLPSMAVQAETPEEWIRLGARVHGAFGAFIPLGIKIGLDATERLDAKPRELAITYYDSNSSPCACFADGIAIATYASVGQRTLTIAPENAPEGTLAVVIIRQRKGGPGFKYTIPASDLAKLGPMNKNLDPQGRWDAVMKEDGLFTVEGVP
jgi:hypothetical protein